MTAPVTQSAATVFSRYSEPFMPWFMRRNEIWLQIAESP